MMPGHTDHDNRLPVSLPFWTVLSVGVGLLVLLAVTTVLGIQLWMNQRNTIQLLNDKVKLTIERIEVEFRRHLQPAVDQTALIQRLLQDGVYEIEDKDGVLDLLVGSLASSPQMRGSVSLELEGAEWPAELWYDRVRSFVEWRLWG